MRSGTVGPKARFVLTRGVLALLLGAAAGIFVNGYWLVDHPARASGLMLAATAVVAGAAAIGWWFLVPTILRALPHWTPAHAVTSMFMGAVLGTFLFFAGTSRWQATDRYIAFLLPVHHFRVEAVNAPAGTSIVWLSTSLGDTSYDKISMEGWSREGDRLVLETPTANSLTWSEVTGKSIVVVLQAEASGGSILLAWEGGAETIRLGPRRTTFERPFEVPWYASRQMVLALGLANFWVLALFLVVLGRELDWKTLLGERTEGAERAWPVQRELTWVAVLTFLALLLRVFNLEAVFPAVDEYYHLIAADQILKGAALGSVYQRSLWTVTMPVAAALRAFGHEVWAARLVGAMFNALAVIPLWLLARRVNRGVAIAACTLFATSPWVITFARVAREYAYYPFYFYWIVFAMASLILAIPPRFVVVSQWRKLVAPRVLVPALALLLPPIFALKLDLLSTFRTILIAYLILGVFVMGRLDWRNQRNWPFVAAAGLAIAWAGYSWYQEQVTKLLPQPRLNAVPLQYFFPNPEQQWYFARAGVLIALGLVMAVVWGVRQRRGSPIPLFFVGLYLCYLLVFAFVSKSFFHTRHLLSTQLWFLLVVAMGLYAIWSSVRMIFAGRSRFLGAALVAALALLTVNPVQVILPSVSTEPDVKISEDYMHDMTSVQAFMLQNAAPEDALISTVYGLYAEWEGKPRFVQADRIYSHTTQEELEHLLGQHATGWLIIDSIRLDLSVLSKQGISAMPRMEYIGLFGDEYVWRWGSFSARPTLLSLDARQWTSH